MVADRLPFVVFNLAGEPQVTRKKETNRDKKMQYEREEREEGCY
jgi:hypothetical protein